VNKTTSAGGTIGKGCATRRGINPLYRAVKSKPVQEEVTQYLRAGDHLNAPLAAKNCTLAPWRLVMASKEAAA